MQKKLISGAVFAAFASIGGQASAAMTETRTFDLNDFPAAIYGDANLTPTSTGACPADQSSPACYIKADLLQSGQTNLNANNSVIIGTVRDSNALGAHLHQGSDALDAGNRMIHTHADAGGIYVRMRDSSAFSLLSLELFAPGGTANPDPNGYFEILGFSDAINQAGVNSDLIAGNGTNYANRVAYQQVQGADYADSMSSLLLNNDFSNIKAFWIHFGGWGKVPYDPDLVLDEEGGVVSDGPLTAPVFNLYVDNIKLAQAGVQNPSAVPVPGAVWMFGSGLLGLLSFGKRKQRSAHQMTV